MFCCCVTVVFDPYLYLILAGRILSIQMAKSTTPYLPLQLTDLPRISSDLQETASYSVLQSDNPPQPQVSLTQPIQFNAPTVIVQIKLGDTPMRLVCPCCKSDIVTKIILENTEETWARFRRILCWCPLLCFCCAILSCCCDSTKNFRHECPQCQVHLGTYKPHGQHSKNPCC